MTWGAFGARLQRPRVGKQTLGASEPEELAELRRRMADWTARGSVAGGVVLLARAGEVVFRETTGCLDRERRIPMRSDALFRLTSLTKPLTSAGFMMLAQAGRIGLGDAVEEYLPEFRGQRLWNGERPSRPITARDLLTHSAGLVDSIPPNFPWANSTLAEVAAEAGRQPLAFEPGSRWFYGNLGYITVGRLIEVLSGEPYAQYMERRLFGPLGMRDSFLQPPAREACRVARCYCADESGAVLPENVESVDRRRRFVSPTSDLCSTASDLMRFFEMMRRGGELDGRRVLTRETVAEMLSVSTGSWNAGFIPGFGYGLGFSLMREPAGVFHGHSAGTFGHGGAYQTHVWVEPERELTSIFLFQHRCEGPISAELAEFLELSRPAAEPTGAELAADCA